MLVFTACLTLASCVIAPQEPEQPAPVQRELRIHSLHGLVESQDGWIGVGDGGSIRFGFRYPTEAEHAANPDLKGVSIPDTRGSGPDPARIRDWAELAVRFCVPALDPQQERIEAENQGYLISYLQPAQHLWLEQFLNLQRTDGGAWHAMVEGRIYRMPPGMLARMKLTGSATLLPDAAAIERQRKLLEDARAELVSAPQLTTLPGQRGNLSVLNEVAYVKEYELHVIEPGNVEILDPVVEVIQEGLLMEVRVLQVSEGLYGLELTCTNAELERPIPTKKVRPSPLFASEVEIGQPVVHTAKVNATVRLADGSGVLLVAAGSDESREIAVLLTFRRRAPHVVDYELGDF